MPSLVFGLRIAPEPEMFLSDAKREVYYNNYIHALLNAVVALEIKVSEIIRTISAKRKIEKESVDQFIKDVGITGNIKTTLKLLTPETIKLPSDDVFEHCKGAITIRNKIMHVGRIDVPNTINDFINNIEVMIKFCDQL